MTEGNFRLSSRLLIPNTCWLSFEWCIPLSLFTKRLRTKCRRDSFQNPRSHSFCHPTFDERLLWMQFLRSGPWGRTLGVSYPDTCRGEWGWSLLQTPYYNGTVVSLRSSSGTDGGTWVPGSVRRTGSVVSPSSSTPVRFRFPPTVLLS